MELNFHRNSDSAVFGDWKEWVPSYLPQEPVRVSKVPRIPAPKRFLRRLEQLCTCGFRFRENGVNIATGPGVVRECDSAQTQSRSGKHSRPLQAPLADTEQGPFLQPERTQSLRLWRSTASIQGFR